MDDPATAEFRRRPAEISIDDIADVAIADVPVAVV